MFNKKKKEIEKLNAEVKRIKDESDELCFKIGYKNAEILKLKERIIYLEKHNISLMVKIKELIDLL